MIINTPLGKLLKIGERGTDEIGSVGAECSIYLLEASQQLHNRQEAVNTCILLHNYYSHSPIEGTIAR